jgi:site-specific recombinase XerC
MIADDLPDGDVCFVRQVFQHLSNGQIAQVLPKLRKYRRIYITEHLPSALSKWRPNLDKLQGADIRMNSGSGIDITAEPFNVPGDEVEIVMEVCGNDAAAERDPGVIRTVLYTPGIKTSNNAGMVPECLK